VGAWGEARLIESLRRCLGSASLPSPRGIGDDCAVLTGPAPTLVTVDPLVFGRHFDATLSPSDAGAKLLKRNLSDIAAMGGRPSSAVVALVLSPDVRVSWLERFYRGLGAAARRYHVKIVGGDIAQASLAGPNARIAGFFSASLTLLGTAPSGCVVTRDGARIGDRLYVTGELGRSFQTGHHFRFEPRLREGEWLARRPEVRALMDVSDGIGKDVRALVPPRALPALWEERLPRRAPATTIQALSDGEDYELLFAVSAAAETDRFEKAFRAAFPRVRLSQIGEMVAKGKMPKGALPEQALQGYEHFR
jgi:thiamine-monophosphate kinase